MKNQRNINRVGVVSNIILSVLYASFSWLISGFGLMVLVRLFNNWTIGQILLLSSCILFICTPIFSIVGILLSIILRKMEKYVFSFIIQFLPFVTILLAELLFATQMIFGNA